MRVAAEGERVTWRPRSTSDIMRRLHGCERETSKRPRVEEEMGMLEASFRQVVHHVLGILEVVMMEY